MVESQQSNTGSHVGKIVVRPNQSFTWRASKMFLLMLLALSLTIAISFLIRGYWLTLPFSLLEVSAVAACFIIILKRAQQQQVIDISTDRIRVAEGRRRPERVVNWQRYFTKVIVEQPRYAWYNTAIKLKHNNEEIELGGFLNQAERQQLIAALRDLINAANHRQIQT